MNAVTLFARHITNPNRWISLRLAIVCQEEQDRVLSAFACRPSDRTEGIASQVVYPADFSPQITPEDELAEERDYRDWEAGIVSGFHYIVRYILDGQFEDKILIFQVEGSLTSSDMVALAHASGMAFARVVKCPSGNSCNSGWATTFLDE